MMKHRLVGDLLLNAASRWPEHVALIVGDREYSYAQLLTEASRLARVLASNGVKRGDRVVVYMAPCWWCAVAVFAISLSGAAFVLIHEDTKSQKLRQMLVDCTPSVVLTDPARLERARDCAGQGSHVLCVADERSTATDAPTDFVTALGRASDAVDLRRNAIELDLAALIYTSGSSGVPKGVMMSHQAMVFAVHSISEYLELSGSDRIVSLLPLAFDYGLYQLLMSVSVGATLLLEPSFRHPGVSLRRIRERAVTVLPAVPTVFAMLLELGRRQPEPLLGVRTLTNTAAALPRSMGPGLRALFPNARLFSMYGLTECKRVSYLPPELYEQHPDSVGVAIPGTEVCIRRPDGTLSEPGEVGILHVRGPHVMMGYWNQPLETQRMLRPGTYPGERVLVTQDLFFKDANGLLYFAGRSDDIIKSAGHKVSPLEVERALQAIPDVREAAVVGVPDVVFGEKIRAFVALAPGVRLDAARLLQAAAARLEGSHVPHEVIFLDSLPKTKNGKIAKQELRAAAAVSTAMLDGAIEQSPEAPRVAP